MTCKDAGLINHRGHMCILAWRRIEAASCECYGATKREFERRLGIGRR